MRTVVVSSGPSAASVPGARIRPAAPAAAMLPRKPRRVWISAITRLPPHSRLQLAFDELAAMLFEPLVHLFFVCPDQTPVTPPHRRRRGGGQQALLTRSVQF